MLGQTKMFWRGQQKPITLTPMGDLPAHIGYFLRHPAALGVTGVAKLIETHISYVLLTGCYAYKFKKPVDLEFLDYRRVEDRKRYCLAELALNRRFSPTLYLDVLAVLPDREGYLLAEVGAEGVAVDYCVQMREFPQDAILSALARARRLEQAPLERFAKHLVNVHASVPVVKNRGGLEDVRAALELNYAQARTLGCPGLPPEMLGGIQAFTTNWLGRYGTLIEQRRAAGCVRECHGDLHLSNLVQLDGEVFAFDCIEFSDRYRMIDWASELAFLVMDLEAHEYLPIANRVLNEYLETSGGWDALQVLPLYLCYRAFVRGKIHAILAAEPQPGMEQPQVRETAARYYRLSHAYAIRHSRPGSRLTIMHGVSGSGKSFVARRLAQESGAIHIRSDAVRKHLAGVPLGAAPSGSQDGLYSAAMTARTYDQMNQLARLALAHGFSVILDARFPKCSQREAARQVAEAFKADFSIVVCEADRQVLRERLRMRTRDISDATAELLAQQFREIESLSDAERKYVQAAATS